MCIVHSVLLKDIGNKTEPDNKKIWCNKTEYFRKNIPCSLHIMAERFEGDFLTLDRINCKCCCTRSLKCCDIRDPKIHRRSHDLVMVLTGLLVLGGVDDKADLAMPHHIKHIRGAFL